MKINRIIISLATAAGLGCTGAYAQNSNPSTPPAGSAIEQDTDAAAKVTPATPEETGADPGDERKATRSNAPADPVIPGTETERTTLGTTQLTEEEASVAVTEDTSENTLVQAENLTGASVLTPEDEVAGSIEHLLIDSKDGKVTFAIVSVGGFLGIGDRHVAVPWEALDIQEPAAEGEEVRVVLSADKDKLEAAPQWEERQMAEFSDSAEGRTIRDYWGVTERNANTAMPQPAGTGAEAGIDTSLDTELETDRPEAGAGLTTPEADADATEALEKDFVR